MSENAHRISDLIIKLQKGEISAEEMQELNEWKADNPGRQELFNEMTDPNLLIQGLKSHEEAKKKILAILRQAIPELRLKMLPIQWRYAAAAGLIIAFIGGWYVFSKREAANKAPQVAITQPTTHDIPAPKGSHTILTLASGRQIILDSTGAGAIGQEGGTRISKQSDNQVVYNVVNEKPTEVLFNTLRTTRGGQTSIALADGSKVWLNASSSIRFPNVFTGPERRVQVTGEAYFEVAHNQSVPFIVETKSASIKVLGTHFNVMAYEDEDLTNTTLLSGSVMVSNNGKSSLLKPGQQAQVASGGNINVLKDIDTAQAVAWKNGKFEFDGTNLRVVMRQLERWYDIHVTYENDAYINRLSGGIRRNVSLSNVLKMLERNGSRLKVEGNEVTVLK